MGAQLDPSEIFDRAASEGKRRLDQSLLELAATSFIAGFTVVFGVVALGIVRGYVAPSFPDLAPLVGALAFGPGIAFLVVGRTELFNENFVDPTAAAVSAGDTWLVRPIARLWVVTLAFNLLGGLLVAPVFAVEGALPVEAVDALRGTATEMVGRTPLADAAKGVAGGALVALMSYLVSASNGVGGRIWISYVVGVLLALGPFDHVVVTVLHVAFGVLFGASIALGDVLEASLAVTVGNLVGGMGLVTLAHVAQAVGEGESTG